MAKSWGEAAELANSPVHSEIMKYILGQASAYKNI